MTGNERQEMGTTTSERKTAMGGPRGGNILEFYTEEFKPQPSGAELFRQHVVQWFFAAKHVRMFEALRLTVEKPSEDDLRSHRMVCSTLITFGEFASIFARRESEQAGLSALGVTVEDIEAETRLLRDNFRMFHDHPMADEEADRVLAEAFGR
jgi:hypothetical protein